MRIGIVTTWFERGAAYVSKQYEELLKDEHEVFIYARGGEEYAIGDPKWDNETVYWGKKYPMPANSTYVDNEDFIKWIKQTKVDTVLFNEQKWWQTIKICREFNIKTGAYIDYYTDDTLEMFNLYDFLICNTKRHSSAFSSHKQCYYVPWGTDTNVFLPKEKSQEYSTADITYFHSSGMSPYRKGTDFVIKAFDQLSKKYKNCQLIIHAQVNLLDVFPEMKEIINSLIDSKKIIIINKTITAPGLFHCGDVYLYPSRIDGIGLTIAEALSSGLPTITVDNAPMNEFISEPSLVANVKKFYCRDDGYYWPMCEVDIDDLESKMEVFIHNIDKLPIMKELTRKSAEENLNWNNNKKIVNDIFKNSKILTVNSQLLKKIDKYDTGKYPMLLKFPMFYSYLYKYMKFFKNKIV